MSAASLASVNACSQAFSNIMDNYHIMPNAHGWRRFCDIVQKCSCGLGTMYHTTIYQIQSSLVFPSAREATAAAWLARASPHLSESLEQCNDGLPKMCYRSYLACQLALKPGHDCMRSPILCSPVCELLGQGLSLHQTCSGQAYVADRHTHGKAVQAPPLPWPAMPLLPELH